MPHVQTTPRNPSPAGKFMFDADLARLLALNAAIEAASLGEAGRVTAANARLAGDIAERAATRPAPSRP
jgi:hypothetical protein